MRPTFRKLEVKDIGDLERLVAENIEGIEPGLKVVDSRLLLGQATIDLVGLDARDSLVLIALDFTADEGLLLRVMDAYSWCLEYPEAIHRLYPVAQVSQIRPPRILFIVERLTDSFVRRIKQLSFLEIDCLEFRHLEVNGASALYFDLVQRLRRAEVPSFQSEPLQVTPLPVADADLPRAAVDAAPAPAPVVTPVVAEPSMVAPDASGPAIEAPAPVVTPVVAEPSTVTPDASGPAIEAPAPDSGPIVAAVESAEEQFVETSTAAPEVPQAEIAPPPVELVLESATAASRQTEIPAPSTNGARSPWQTLVEDLGGEAQTPISEPDSQPESAIASAEPTPAPQESVEASREPVKPPAWAKSSRHPVSAPNRTYFFAQAAKGNTPSEEVPAPTAQDTPKAVETPNTTGEPGEPRAELEAMNFPKDGLSRQWLEFLNQLSTTK